jgi:hypothetical protein
MSGSIYDGTKYLYAEQLKGKRVTLTIKEVKGGIEFVDQRGGKNVGFDVSFVETDKVLGVTGITVRRQMFMATGTDDPGAMAGKKVTLYSVKSAKSATGLAIRVAVPEQMA